MFAADRTFSLQNKKTVIHEWYIQAREGNLGPYRSKNQAESILKKFTETCILAGATGGRDPKNETPNSSLLVKSFIDYEGKGDINWI